MNQAGAPTAGRGVGMEGQRLSHGVAMPLGGLVGWQEQLSELERNEIVMNLYVNCDSVMYQANNDLP